MAEAPSVEETPASEVTPPPAEVTTPSTEVATPTTVVATPTDSTTNEENVGVVTIAPPPEFVEDVEDKLSDEGIGPSADEKSDTSSQVRHARSCHLSLTHFSHEY